MTDTGLPEFPFSHPQGLDLIPEYERFRNECPVTKVRLKPGGEAYLIARYRDVRRIFDDDTIFSRADTCKPESAVLLPGSKIPDVMLAMDRPEHTRLRKLVVQAFTTGAVARVRPRIEQIAEELIDELVEKGPGTDFIPTFAVPFPAQVICELLGVPTTDVDQMIWWLQHLLSVSRFTMEETVAALDALGSYCYELVVRKREEPADDLVSGLIAAHDQGERMTEPELVKMIYLILGAGFETSANMVPNALVTFGRHPDQWELLRQDPDRVPTAVEEVLRYVSVSQAGLDRVTRADVELSGCPVPARSTVIPLLSSANMDASIFERPERFDVRRSPNPHLGFGHGPHRCVGAPLALVELEVAFRTLLARVPGIRPAVPLEELEWKQGMGTRAMVALPVVW
ncbi:MAG TPA: cytochrome P450 [Mycobacteriales bacterium]|nr:cytochrome P450 [Mycobacteriales bacterium]